MNRVLLSILCLTIALTSVRGAAVNETYGHAADGTTLHWDAYVPTSGGPWPSLVLMHEGGFKSGALNGVPMQVTAQDLANAGYLALAIEYRLAPPGGLSGQVADGRAPQQYDDCKLAVRAARADPRCNGQVGAVGGSSGATHAVWLAITGTAGDDRVEVAVAMSTDVDFTNYLGVTTLDIRQAVTNYCNTPNVDPPSSGDRVILQSYSPAFVVDRTASPIFDSNSTADPMPFQQLALFDAAIANVGAARYRSQLVPGVNHGFEIWPSIKASALAFLTAGFNGPAKAPGARAIGRRRSL